MKKSVSTEVCVRESRHKCLIHTSRGRSRNALLRNARNIFSMDYVDQVGSVATQARLKLECKRDEASAPWGGGEKRKGEGKRVVAPLK